MNDDEIGRLFDLEHTPHRGPEYWDRIRATLDAVDAEESGVSSRPVPRDLDTGRLPARPSTMHTIQDAATIQPHQSVTDGPVRPVNTARSTNRPSQRGRILLAAAALLIGAGIGVTALSAIDRSSSTETITDPVGSMELIQPGDDTSLADGAEDAASTDPTVPPPLVNQAEPGLRFDFGALARIDEIDGVWWIWFDRYSVAGASGVDLDGPFSAAFASDAPPIGNVNPGLRTYRLAANATVRLIDPVAYEVICGGEGRPDEPFFFTSTLDDLPSDLSRISPYWWDGTMLASLEFNEAGEVSVLSDSRGC